MILDIGVLDIMRAFRETGTSVRAEGDPGEEGTNHYWILRGRVPLAFPGNNPSCTGVVWFVKVRRTAMGWRGVAELERVGHRRYVNVCKSCDPDGSLLLRTYTLSSTAWPHNTISKIS